MSVSTRSYRSETQSPASASGLSSRRHSMASMQSVGKSNPEDIRASMNAALSRTGSHLSALAAGSMQMQESSAPAVSLRDEMSVQSHVSHVSIHDDWVLDPSAPHEPSQSHMLEGDQPASLWPAEPPDAVAEPINEMMPTGNYLYDFYTKLLIELQEDTQDTLQRLIHQEMQLRKRLYALANADMFRVRFLEEARWELRERHEVIARREKLERSRLEKEMLEVIREQMVGSGGSWSEDAQRSVIEQQEEKHWRKMIETHRKQLKLQDECEWEAYLAAEDKWRWDVELAVRHGMHQIQLDEHRHRNYLETEMYPANLNKLMHAMELEWVELLKSQSTNFHTLLGSSFTKLIKDEEDQRSRLQRRNRKALSEFYLLQQMLDMQHLEQQERCLLEETADRLFGILFSRETVQIRALLDRTRMLNESMTQALAERASLSNNVMWGGEVYPDVAPVAVASDPVYSSRSRETDSLKDYTAHPSQVTTPNVSLPVYQYHVPQADIEAAAALLN